jgi:hypothetical protein
MEERGYSHGQYGIIIGKCTEPSFLAITIGLTTSRYFEPQVTEIQIKKMWPETS